MLSLSLEVENVGIVRKEEKVVVQGMYELLNKLL
jgi:hypothetical protein